MAITANFTGQGIKPQVQSAGGLSATVVRILFSEAMDNNADLKDPANYTVAEAVGSVARTVASISPEQAVGPSYLDLTLDGEMTAGTDNYNVQVDTSVKDLAGNTLDPAADDVDFHGYGVVPVIRKVVAGADDLTKVRVVFSKAVKQVSSGNPDDALNPANYSITGSSSVVVSSVSTVTTNIVELTVGGQVASGEYVLDVVGGPLQQRD
jgi:hypothetical protein